MPFEPGGARHADKPAQALECLMTAEAAHLNPPQRAKPEIMLPMLLCGQHTLFVGHGKYLLLSDMHTEKGVRRTARSERS